MVGLGFLIVGAIWLAIGWSFEGLLSIFVVTLFSYFGLFAVRDWWRGILWAAAWLTRHLGGAA